MAFFHFYSNLNKKILYANSGEPDQTPLFAASDLVLHCLPMSHKKDSMLIWVNEAKFGTFLFKYNKIYSNCAIRHMIGTFNFTTPSLFLCSLACFFFIKTNMLCMIIDYCIGQPMRFEYLSCLLPAKGQTSPRIHRVSPD